MVDDWDEWPLKLKKKAISHTIQIILMHLPKGKLCFLILWSNLLLIPPDMYTIFAFLKEKEWGKWWWNAFHKCQGFAGGKKGPDHYDHRSPEWWLHTECMRKITVRWLLSPQLWCVTLMMETFSLGTLMMTMINAAGFQEVKGYYTPIHLDQHMGQPFTFPKSS